MTNAQPLVVEEYVNQQKVRYASKAGDAGILADIYKETCNIAIWQRQLDPSFLASLQQFVQSGSSLTMAKQISINKLQDDIQSLAAGEPFAKQLHAYIAELCEMYACLFDAKTIGFRISTLNRAMCPRFHVDRVVCRLVTTFLGDGSQWLEQDKVFRDRLGHSSGKKSDSASGIYQTENDIQKLHTGDVALLKGELWQNNENGGLVHRSPPVPNDQARIVMTLDLVD